MIHHLTTPLEETRLASLLAGDEVSISGRLIVARDVAHLRLLAEIRAGRPLPFDPRGQIIYYMGPSPTPPGRVIGSSGPTTSGRMDVLTPPLLDLGVKGLLGKGRRSPEVREILCRRRAIYLAAGGGVGALLSLHILEAKIIAWPELGPEALRSLWVDQFPALVINDLYGADFYDLGPNNYRLS
ncbi:MAG: fumarate hydratase [Candidatus Adiutrix intracellularis]|nr:MAG: fumarate hydratase [Candidatus Adiutrix intracellularis]MDR2827765.1 fumarate hydratase C-terminal domain-containing protein [Candidatus Adiutrix intracellularis]